MNLALETLTTKRLELQIERNKMIAQFDQEITEIETAIEQLSGKKVWEITEEVRYDDENPNYIKSSQEEI